MSDPRRRGCLTEEKVILKSPLGKRIAGKACWPEETMKQTLGSTGHGAISRKDGRLALLKHKHERGRMLGDELEW